MSLATIIALFGSLVVLASIPSVSVLAVTARAAAFGFSHGLFAAIGIVVGDIIFILIAVYGLVFVSNLMGDQFFLVQLVGGIYLIWLGTSLWRQKVKSQDTEKLDKSSLGSSFLTGLLITLGDQKAILFYLGFFPAFIDLDSMTVLDTLTIILLAALGVGGPKLVYAWLADRARVTTKDSNVARWLNGLAAGVMILVGIVLLLKSGNWI